MKTLTTLLITFCFLGAYAQDFIYTFKLTGVTEPGDAKYAINDMRSILEVKTVYFDDDTDKFEIHTDLDFEITTMMEDLYYGGLLVDGEISKINVE